MHSIACFAGCSVLHWSSVRYRDSNESCSRTGKGKKILPVNLQQPKKMVSCTKSHTSEQILNYYQIEVKSGS